MPSPCPVSMVTEWYTGSSFSGGNVIYAAAIDKRIKAAIVQAPAVSGETRSLAFRHRILGLLEDRKRFTSDLGHSTVPLVAPDRESADPPKQTPCFQLRMPTTFEWAEELWQPVGKLCHVPDSTAHAQFWGAGNDQYNFPYTAPVCHSWQWHPCFNIVLDGCLQQDSGAEAVALPRRMRPLWYIDGGLLSRHYQGADPVSRTIC
jgi:hypothetical protein